jgi:hypothetical protein
MQEPSQRPAMVRVRDQQSIAELGACYTASDRVFWPRGVWSAESVLVSASQRHPNTVEHPGLLLNSLRGLSCLVSRVQPQNVPQQHEEPAQGQVIAW